jgi:hypothetical protein
LKRSKSSSRLAIDATNAQPAENLKNGTTIVLLDCVWSRIVPYIDSKTLLALACAGKSTRDAAVFRGVAYGRSSLLPT